MSIESEKVLTVTASRVREAAEQCPDAGRVLKTLFPGAFNQQVQFTGVISVKDAGDIFSSVEYPGALFLPSVHYTWTVEEKLGGNLYLVPSRRK